MSYRKVLITILLMLYSGGVPAILFRYAFPPILQTGAWVVGLLMIWLSVVNSIVAIVLYLALVEKCAFSVEWPVKAGEVEWP